MHDTRAANGPTGTSSTVNHSSVVYSLCHRRHDILKVYVASLWELICVCASRWTTKISVVRGVDMTSHKQDLLLATTLPIIVFDISYLRAAGDTCPAHQ